MIYVGPVWQSRVVYRCRIPAVPVGQPRLGGQGEVPQCVQNLMCRGVHRCREIPAVPVGQPRLGGQGGVPQCVQNLMCRGVDRCRDTCSTCGTTQAMWARVRYLMCWGVHSCRDTCSTCGTTQVVWASVQNLMRRGVDRCRDTCSTCGTTQVVWARGSPPTCWRSGASPPTGLCWRHFWCLSSTWKLR